jgi:hypothetical protein
MTLLIVDFTIPASDRTNRCPEKSGAAQPLYGPIIVRAEAACAALLRENTPPADAARIALTEAIRELKAIEHDAAEAERRSKQ